MKTKLAVLGLGVGMLAAVTPVRAHHSFAGTYLEDAPPVKIERSFTPGCLTSDNRISLSAVGGRMGFWQDIEVS